MRPENLGFEDCDIIPYCRITEPNTQCDSQNPKTTCKLPTLRDSETDKQVVDTNSNNKTGYDPEKETGLKPNLCKELKSSLETKSTSIKCDRNSASSPKRPPENVPITDSNNSESSIKGCKDEYPNNNRDKNSTDSTSSPSNFPPKEKNCCKRLYDEKAKICHQNKEKILGSTCEILMPKDSKSVNSDKINGENLNSEKDEARCSSKYVSGYSDSCSSNCPYFKNTKKRCLPNSCNDCQKFYESFLSNINSHSVPEKSSKNCIKYIPSFEDNEQKIDNDTDGDQSSQLEVEERKISYEELCAKCPSTEKTCDNFGAKLPSQIKTNESFCNYPIKKSDLKEDLLDENSIQSSKKIQSCSDYSSKEQDSIDNFNEEQSRNHVEKKKCDCKDRKYCKIIPVTEKDKDKVEDLNDKFNLGANTKETISNSPAWKQYFEDFCKENKKLTDLKENRSCFEKYVNSDEVESDLNPSNTSKNILKQEEISEKQLSEPLKKKKCACKRANENEDSQKLCKGASNKQIEKRKCCCKNKNCNNQETSDIDLCEKKSIKECPRKKQSFEDFCKEKQKLSEHTDDICSNRQIRCGQKPQDVENKHFFQNKIETSDLAFNLSISNYENSKAVYPLKNEVDLKESLNELGSDSSSKIISLNESILLLKIRNPYLREYFEARENGSILSSSTSNKFPESISHVCSQSSVSVEIKFSQLFQNSFCSDNNIKCITKKISKNNEQVLTESFRENNILETKLVSKWSQYLLEIQNESDEELCKQYDEYLRQEEQFRKAKLNTSSDQSITKPQSDFLFNMNSTDTSSSESIQNLSLNIEAEKLPSSIPVIVEGPPKSNNNDIKIWNNCLSMPLGPDNINNSANKKFPLESLQSTMDSDTVTRKCFTNPIKLQATSKENRNNTASSGATELCCKNEDSTCKVTINRLDIVEESDHKLSLNEDQPTKERSIILSPKISFLNKESFKAFSDAHDHTMTTIKYAMQDITDTIYKTTSEVALSAVTRIQSETTKPIEIMKNYRQSEASSQIKKFIEENAENKVKIIISKINGGDDSQQPFYEKIYVKANEVLKSTMSYVEDSVLRNITIHNFNDESSVYDVPNPNTDSKCSKVQDIAHVVSSSPLSDMFTTMTAKFWTMFSKKDGCEDNISLKISETLICSNLSESDTESEEDVD